MVIHSTWSGLSFTVSEDGTNTTYTYDGTSWDNTLPTGTQFSLGDISFTDWDAFKTAAEAKITRHDTTDSTAVNNGAQITVSLGNWRNRSKWYYFSWSKGYYC